MLTEAHTAALANETNTYILVFQDKARDAYNSSVQVLLYEPGWKPPHQLKRPDVKVMVKGGQAVALHLNKQVTHYSAMVPDRFSVSLRCAKAPRLTRRKSKMGRTLPDGSIDVEFDD